MAQPRAQIFRQRRPIASASDQQKASQIFPHWISWESVSIIISRLPASVNTFTLWRSFKVYGNIDYIEIFENAKGTKEGRAKIKFKPPPREVFCPDGIHNLQLDNGQSFVLSVNIDPKRPSGQVQSPTDPNVFYPTTMELPISRFDFGTLIENSHMLTLRTLQSTPANQTRCSVDCLRREISIYFNLSGTDTRAVVYSYRIRIGFVHLSRVLRQVDAKSVSLVIVLDSPPTYHRKLNDITHNFDDSDNVWRASDSWLRQTDIPYSQTEATQASLSLKRTNSLINIGRWTTFRLTFGTLDNAVLGRKLEVFQNICKDFNIEVQDAPDFMFSPNNGRIPAWRWIDPPNRNSKQTTSLQDLAEEDYIPLPFAVRYQLEVCLSNGVLSEYNIDKAFITSLLDLGETKARELLEHVAGDKQVYYDPMKIFDILFVKSSTSRRIPKYCCYMRTAKITPSTVYFGTPSVDTSNRVVRHYIEYADRFLRVRFTDEKREGRINPCHNNTMDEIFTRIKRCMMNGITLGDRHYEFLAFGNSQFREHGAYFFASLPHLTASHIRAWMGHFSDIKIVAKHAARLGQCFSTTRAVTGCPVQIREIEEIERNGCTFSDGVGRISKFLAQMIMTEFKIKTPNGEPPSVYQFRLGGCKGILAISPEAQRQEVHIRKSQYKFPAIHNGLEVIRHSQFSMATLNRQLIVVLSTLNVADEVFIDKLRIMLRNLDLAMTDGPQAIHLLQKYIDPNQMTLVLVEMVQDGFQESKDPFVTSILELWRAWQIKYLKEKAKIVIENGACLFGCIDETATLRGFFKDKIPPANASYEEKLEALPEVFVQISRPEHEGKYEIIEGPCIIARNPSLHPGDIRVVRAVNIPALHHLRDVLVFPQTGDKDLPSMCSGGDLDGDDYLVIWDQDLLPEDWFRQPMEYAPSVKPQELPRDVTVNDITSFFVTYMKNDCLPRIAHAHLALADYLERGVNDPKCIRLAELHSAAVDYNKTGVPAKMTKDLFPRKWPHFMEKKHKSKEAQYVSQRILGQLYDIVERVNYQPNLEAPFDDRIFNSGIEVPDNFISAAAEIKILYDADMRRIMAQHEIKTEFEVWSTFVLHHANMSKDYSFHEEIGRISSALRERFRGLCFEKAGGKDFEHLAPFAIAMFQVTRNELKEALGKMETKDGENGGQLPRKGRGGKMPLISFPWLFQPLLGKIANGYFDSGSLDETGLWTGQPSQRKRGSVKGDGNKPRDIETADGIQHAGQVLQLFDDHDPWDRLGDLERVDSAMTGFDVNGIPEKPQSAKNSNEEPHNQLIDLDEDISAPTSPLSSTAVSFDSCLSLMDMVDSMIDTRELPPKPDIAKIEPVQAVEKAPSEHSPHNEDAPDIDNGEMDIIEQEGEIKPSALDALEALLRM